MLPPVGQGSPLIRTNIKAEPVVALLGISIWSYLIVTVLPLLVGVLVKAVNSTSPLLYWLSDDKYIC